MDGKEPGHLWKHMLILGAEITVPFVPALIAAGNEKVFSRKTANRLFLSSLIIRSGSAILTILMTNSVEMGILAQCLVGVAETAVLINGLNKLP